VRLIDRRTGSRAPTDAGSDDDGALFAAARVNPVAFDQLVDRYADAILNYCYYRLGSWEDAEDAAQQIFTNAWSALSRFDDRGAFRPWLFTIAHHHVVNRWRGVARHASVPLEFASELNDPSPTPEELAIAADHQGRVLALFSQLSIDQRRVMELRLAGLSDIEIAAVLGRSPGAVRAVESRAIARLRALLGIHGSSLSESEVRDA
jgi:RNA polymerase sigma-70 factor (ECF subfamily)